MQKIRMNTEFRNKILNRYVQSAEKENTQEKEAFLQAREDVDKAYTVAFPMAQQVLSRHFPKEDVDTCRTLKKKYGSPLDVVAKDKCFNFAYVENRPLEEDEDEDDLKKSEHFDFGLYGNVGEGRYDDRTGEAFANAYYRDELKANGNNPDIFPQMKDKEDNPHLTKHRDENKKFLGYSGYSRYNSDSDNTNGLTNKFDSQWYLDIIGTSHCRQRTMTCTKDEFMIFTLLKQAKSNLITCHEKWIASIEKQKDAMKTGLKAYRYLSEGVELMKELGIEIDEAELVRTNSTGLTIYNPVNLASMIKGMKNTTQTREQKIAERLLYEKQNQATN
jgi:hypothetical protein